LLYDRYKVLVSAYSCEPLKGSEPGVGWNWVRQIARFNDIWVITRANNKKQIENAAIKKNIRNVNWIYFDLPKWTRFWKKGTRGVHLYYCLWQIGTYLIARRIHKKIKFDLVHHLTFGNYWMPTFIYLLKVPFVWGPLGGGESAPKPFLKSFSRRGRIQEHLRVLTRYLFERTPFVKLAVKNASVTLVKSKETSEKLKILGSSNLQLYSEAGLTEEEFKLLEKMPFRRKNPFRLISIGRLLYLKGFHFGLMAFNMFQKEYAFSEYWLIGEGPERRNLESLAVKLGIIGKVRFLGGLSRIKVLEKLGECDVLLHPSLHDSGGWVCLEAMAAGCPIICLDIGGPSVQVTCENGFKIQADSPHQVVKNITEAIINLANNETLRMKMGEIGRKRIREFFLWSNKVKFIQEIYRKTMNKLD